ncbi:glycerol-3-phosphate 1-O-acyltransferase PlsY [Alcaligenes sp. RM2]|uniref:glycerol-3-phosphate 1-O-acyltransferase PlsY n=1 Tax=Alcaligenes TaxID=507 RepID=UPI0002AAAA31|nr:MULTISPECIES: glycerol-3-phosphate 1-O-acyltransferase PlsY [Alcaligenes]EKU28715.1 glycerol-3-phosphate acyltransferase PlsY [Alcaligenes sp. HPC1271]ERI34150.1 glycerol-3-phosphate acyltransferase [Alcaligenes sp. EGD-AK7]HRO19161.1 glycerol-3-phosphate 1-O-acyltransferase PlsY [Alcaligenes phenolicus]HRP15258.1 glycerol-3-phosphate 1-O-acyltransferase PlsY [Alcaligenes phenolicus]
MNAVSFAVAAPLVALLSYLLGSLPFAVIVSKIMGLQDPRTFGSKNPGATNVLRSGNKKAAVLTLLGDAFKGWLAVFLTQQAISNWGWAPTLLGVSAFFAFLGHLYPVFLGFKGGKGVATALGVILALLPWLALATAATWLIIAYVSRYSSLAAIISAVFAPLFYLLGAKVVWPMNASIATALALISAFLLWRHQENIRRLMTGKESKIGSKKK